MLADSYYYNREENLVLNSTSLQRILEFETNLNYVVREYHIKS